MPIISGLKVNQQKAINQIMHDDGVCIKHIFAHGTGLPGVNTYDLMVALGYFEYGKCTDNPQCTEMGYHLTEEAWIAKFGVPYEDVVAMKKWPLPGWASKP